MIPVKFDYLAPTSVEEAVSALGQHGDDAKILAGGQSLLPVLRMRLNAPEVAILSMEAIVKRPRVVEVDGEDVIAIRHMMNMTCSFDHRVLDGAQVGFFLADIRAFLEEWDTKTPIG